jgi:hypothetical protein
MVLVLVVGQLSQTTGFRNLSSYFQTGRIPCLYILRSWGWKMKCIKLNINHVEYGKV